MVLLGNRQGAKRRAAGAVSGEAAERPMEPEAVRAHLASLRFPCGETVLWGGREGFVEIRGPRVFGTGIFGA